MYTGLYTDDPKITYRSYPQQNGAESDEENAVSETFQANYQYTPLKEYAATNNGRPMNDISAYQSKYCLEFYT
jgi:hypothetical protein